MKIDAHHHFWHFRPEELAWIAPEQTELRRDFLPQEFEQELRSAGFDRSVVIQARQSLEETRWLLSLAETWPFLSGVVGWVDLCSPEVEAQIQEFVRHPALVGVRHVVYDEPDDFLSRRDFRQGIRLLQDYGLTFDLLVFPQHLPKVIELVERFPGQNFVLDHLAKPWAGHVPRKTWKDDLRRLAAHPHVSAKLSGLVPEGFPPRWSKDDIQFYLESAFETFGEDRLLIGSNWPVSREVGSYSWILQWVVDYMTSFSVTIQQKVFGENAAAVYGLSLGNAGDGL